MGDGDWVLRKKRRRRMDEQVWYVLYCTGDNVHHQLTGLDWTGQTLILMIHDL